MDELPLSAPNRFSPGWLDFWIVLGAVVLVALGLFMWAFVIRKRKNRIRKYRRHHHRKGFREQFQKSASGIKELIRQQRHPHHRKHRTVNPTLAETGGLPPLRSPDNPPGPPPPAPPS